jgi:hypothetical protein
MKSFKIVNRITGWIIFLIAATVYLLTIEPTSSFWDCGEFIATAFKLEVGHPPGAPLFMIIARFFALFAGGDVSNVAMMINAMSGLASAFTILFLFWSITHLAKKMFPNNGELKTGQLIAIIGSGVVGALAYTFSDTFWFSAVEGEVYALSSLFTAIVFWAILKWENVAHEKHSDRWIVLIAYLMGLSIGVHLLNLLAIPAIVLVYYFKKYKVTGRGIILSLTISVVILSTIMYLIIPGIVKLASNMELEFVNKFGLPFNSGMFASLILLSTFLITSIIATTKKDLNLSKLFYLVSIIALNLWIFGVIIGVILSVVFLVIYFVGKKDIFKAIFIYVLGIIPGWIIWQFFLSEKDSNKLLLSFNKVYNLIAVACTVIVIGYSSFSMIVIRSLADTPMDENNPETVFNLLHYLNREQYGNRPLVTGQYYNAPVTGSTEPFTYQKKDGKYEKLYSLNDIYEFDERFTTFFPRMYSQSNPAHIDEYKKWADIKGKKITIKNYNGETEVKTVPTFGENLKFFFRYQLGHLYWRYFMWNFSGRQNDTQSHGELMNGNWITGFDVIDSKIIGPQDNLPDSIKNEKSRNVYYLLPLILGIIGFFFHLRRHFNDFIVVLFLFVLTGIAIVVYLNQYPLQPRERDYAYAGSFYAFSIWIGLGVLGVYNFLHKKLPAVVSAGLASTICLIFVPGIMASENWDDHDRSNRYIARDFAYNYLNSCAQNGILFTHGDNDTFPLWYAQEVEGIRTDVRVVNLSLLNTHWYIDQMKRKAYDSEPVPFGLTHEEYVNGLRDVIYIQPRIDDYVEVGQAVDFVASTNQRTRIQVSQDEWMDYLPTNKFLLKVDSATVVNNGTVKPEDADKIVKEIPFVINKSRIMKNEWMMLDLLANNNWERPIYFVSSAGDGNIGLNDYLQEEGFAYRLVPIKTTSKGYLDIGRIDSDIMYEKLMEKYKWGNMNDPDVWIDHTTDRTTSVIKIRNKFNRLAKQLMLEGKNEKAVAVLDRCMEIMPSYNFPYDLFTLDMIETYYSLKANDKANTIVEEFAKTTEQEINYLFSMPSEFLASLDYEQRLAFHYMQRLSDMARRSGNIELAERTENVLTTAIENVNRYQ